MRFHILMQKRDTILKKIEKFNNMPKQNITKKDIEDYHNNITRLHNIEKSILDFAKNDCKAFRR